MKKITTFLLTIVMLLSFGMTVYGAETTTGAADKSDVTFESNSIVTPNAWYYSYTKTVTKYYLYLEDVPESIYYSEYNKSMDVDCTGYLYMKSFLVLADGTYKAVFEGTIGAYIF
ncbi:MAG: hypothetical protein WCD89_21310 [Anaerocolumna sp.]